jgi:hypothetical protein
MGSLVLILSPPPAARPSLEVLPIRQGWQRRGEARTLASRLAEAQESRLTPRAPRLPVYVSSDADVEAGPQIFSATWFQVDFILLPAPCAWGCQG